MTDKKAKKRSVDINKYIFEKWPYSSSIDEKNGEVNSRINQFYSLLKKPVSWFTRRSLSDYADTWSEKKGFDNKDKNQLFNAIKTDLDSYNQAPWWKKLTIWWKGDGDIDYKRRWRAHYEYAQILDRLRDLLYKNKQKNTLNDREHTKILVQELNHTKKELEVTKPFLPVPWRQQIKEITTLFDRMIKQLSDMIWPTPPAEKVSTSTDQQTPEKILAAYSTFRRQMQTPAATSSNSRPYLTYVKCCAFLNSKLTTSLNDLQKKYDEMAKIEVIKSLSAKKQRKIKEYGDTLLELKRVYSNQVPTLPSASSLSKQQSREKMIEQAQRIGREDANELLDNKSKLSSSSLVISKTNVFFPPEVEAYANVNNAKSWTLYAYQCGLLQIPLNKLTTLTEKDVASIFRQKVWLKLHDDKVIAYSQYQPDMSSLTGIEKEKWQKRNSERTDKRQELEKHRDMLITALKTVGTLPKNLEQNPYIIETYQIGAKTIEARLDSSHLRDEKALIHIFLARD